MVFVAIVPKLLGTKVILDVHDLMPEMYQSKFGLHKEQWLIRFITWIERLSIGFADRAIAVHKPHLNALISHGNPVEKFIVLLNLPDPKIFANQAQAYSRNNSCFNLIYHGTVADRYGLQIALLALSSLKNEITGLKLLIVGQGDGLDSLKALAKELDLYDHVSFGEAWVPLEELVPIIIEADVGIVPILYDEFTKYMLPTKLLEYTALGIPVICSRTKTIEVYFNNSMVQFSSPGSVAELAKNILFLYQNPDRRRELATNVNKFNVVYNWEKQKLSYYQLIDSLLAK
jgi:glycosyltransferase involved in cell wall biosynthesis